MFGVEMMADGGIMINRGAEGPMMRNAISSGSESPSVAPRQFFPETWLWDLMPRYEWNSTILKKLTFMFIVLNNINFSFIHKISALFYSFFVIVGRPDFSSDLR